MISFFLTLRLIFLRFILSDETSAVMAQTQQIQEYDDNDSVEVNSSTLTQTQPILPVMQIGSDPRFAGMNSSISN